MVILIFYCLSVCIGEMNSVSRGGEVLKCVCMCSMMDVGVVGFVGDGGGGGGFLGCLVFFYLGWFWFVLFLEIYCLGLWIFLFCFIKVKFGDLGGVGSIVL